MPNHCYNQLWISGPDDDVKVFKDLAGLSKEAPELRFNAFVPYPEKWEQMDAEMREIRKLQGLACAKAADAYEAKWGTRSDGYNDGGYQWCCENWGTKWGAYNVGLMGWLGYTVVLFKTAGSPPRPIMDAMAKAFPTLELELQWSEQGGAFHGYRTLRTEDGVQQSTGAQWDNYLGLMGG